MPTARITSRMSSVKPKMLKMHISGVGPDAIMEDRQVGHVISFHNNVSVVVDGHLNQRIKSATLTVEFELEEPKA